MQLLKKHYPHLFNGMSPFHHRDPGLPGATFETENVYASIIADGIHVDYNAISIAKKIMKDRLYLVSDAVEENLNGAYLHTRQKDSFTLRMASTYPARLNESHKHGYIAEGYMANLTVFDKNYKVKQVIIEGKFYL